MKLLVYSLFYISELGDRKTLEEILLNNSTLLDHDTTKEVLSTINSEKEILDLINPTLISQEQKIFIYSYCSLYVRIKFSLLCNNKLLRLMDKLCLARDLAEKIHNSIANSDIHSSAIENSIMESIIFPKQEFSSLVDRLISLTCEKQLLKGISSREYEHDLDRLALEHLSKIPGLDTLIKKFFELGIERLLRISQTGSFIRVTNDSYPELYEMFIKACNILDIEIIPDLYLQPDFEINAFTSGAQNHIVGISSLAVDLLSYDELMFLIGHELGHIKSEHVLYYQLARYIPYLGGIANNIIPGIGGLVSQGLALALYDWQRKSEFTADRAGLLVCQNLEAAIKVHMKFAGLPFKIYSNADVECFIKQATEFEGFDTGMLNKFTKFLLLRLQTHPWTVMRAKELLTWVNEGKYNEILNGCKNKQRNAVALNRCPSCGASIAESQKFCGKCGTALRE
ncbi:MAG: M48 family metallopeptidase [Candidatus Cloacimonas sp.]|jgi:Zn-dependent protease with chaperone function